jgi:nicotinamide-nucleotide amidase
MHAEIIALGDELTSGQALDTNSRWLALRLAELGIRTLYHTTVGDELDAGVGVFRTAIARSDLILATGGLGPTADDLTREMLALATNRELIFSDEAMVHVRSIFARRGRKMPEQNRRQAFLPLGAALVPNPHGTAPGIDLEVLRQGRNPCRVFCVPGVPAEMREMWDATLHGAILAAFPARNVLCHRTVKCFGAGESAIEGMLPDLIRRGREPRVGITANKWTISLRITSETSTQAECEKQIESTLQTIHACLGDLVFGYGDDELQDVVVRTLAEKGRTLASAEWDTAGLLSQWLCDADRSDEVYAGGLVFRDRDVFTPGGLAPRDAVVAAARATREQFGATLGLALGPFPEIDETLSAVPPIHVAVATAKTFTTREFPFSTHPSLRRIYAAKNALDFLRREERDMGA